MATRACDPGFEIDGAAEFCRAIAEAAADAPLPLVALTGAVQQRVALEVAAGAYRGDPAALIDHLQVRARAALAELRRPVVAA